MADAVEPVRHGVQQEPPKELVSSERHHLGLAVMAVVFPGEVDLSVGEAGQARVGECDSVGVATEIGQHLLGSCERALGEDHAFDRAQRIETFGEGGGLLQGGERAGEVQLAGRERRLQPCEEQRTEPMGEDAHRQKEPRPARHPSCAVGRQAAAWDDAVPV